MPSQFHFAVRVHYDTAMAGQRWILHVDMDAFFAAVEQLDQPHLRGRPVLVGHDGTRGVVTTASYEARPFGCHSAQPMVVAKRLCPQAIVVPVRGARYRQVSQQLFEILDTTAPLVEPLSIDEAFLDVSGSERLFGSAPQQAARLKQRIRDELHLTASVGVAPNKFLAKLASDLEKPDGLTVIRPQDVDMLLPGLPVTKVWGVGPSTASRLAGMGVRTIADLRGVSPKVLKAHFGSDAERFGRLAHGLDDRPVVPDGRARSIGHECTFEIDVADRDEVLRVLLNHVEHVGRRLRRHDLVASHVSLKIRFGDFQTVSRSRTLTRSTDSTVDLWEAARSLFNAWANEAFQPVRLIGATAAQLSSRSSQLELFEDQNASRQRRLDETADQITNRFGAGALRRGGSMRSTP